MKPGRYLVLFVISLFSAACSGGMPCCDFVKSSARDDQGNYAFTLDMSDSAGVYSIFFVIRADCPDSRFEEMENIAVEVSLTSPSGNLYREKVYVPKSSYAKGSYFTKDYDMPYREKFSPVEPGIWRMSLSVLNEDKLPGFRGIGIRLQPQKEKNGKR